MLYCCILQSVQWGAVITLDTITGPGVHTDKRLKEARIPRRSAQLFVTESTRKVQVGLFKSRLCLLPTVEIPATI